MLGNRYEHGDDVDQSYQQARELYEQLSRVRDRPLHRKVTREQQNITKQQQDRDMPKRIPIWVFSIYKVKVSSNPMK